MNNKIILKITSGMLLCTILAYTAPVLAYTKDETVYSKLYTNGSSYNTIVNSHIENEEGTKLINDLSDLLNIENVSGDESPKQDGNNLIWNADGSDIYYQGESQKKLPIECKVKYELNGEEIDAKDIAGKSGRVKITLEYINKDSHIVSINGKNETLYTPFIVVCGTIIDNENNKNIEITNGKVIDDGSKTTVIGIILPGMQESLNLSKDKLEIPNTLEITMDSTDFELNNIVTYVTPKVIEDSDLNLFNQIDDIYNKINTLQSSSEQLESGANTLKDGITTYTEKSQEFNNAMNQIADGTSSVNLNYSKIDSGISSLTSGSANLQNGAEELNSGINQLTSELTSLPESVSALYNGSTQVLAGLNSDSKTGKVGLVDGVNSVISSLETSTDTLKETLTQSSAGSENTIKILKSNNASLEAAINALDPVNDKEIIATLHAQITANEKAISASETAKSTADQTKAYVEQKTNASASSIKGIKTGMSTIQNAMTQINIGLGQLNTAANALPNNLTKLSNGSKAIATGSKTLSTGVSNLNKGSTALKSGIQSLDTNTQKLAEVNNQLTDGANTISEGVTTLADGISKFNKEGIQTICNYINGDLKNVTDRLEKLQELSEQYNNFTMLNDGNNGNVKFIMIMDSIKKEEDSKQEIILEDKNKENE